MKQLLIIVRTMLFTRFNKLFFDTVHDNQGWKVFDTGGFKFNYGFIWLSKIAF